MVKSVYEGITIDSDNTAEADRIYMALIKRNHLFGKAFYGHSKSKAETKRIEYLWQQALKEANKHVTGTAEENSGS